MQNRLLNYLPTAFRFHHSLVYAELFAYHTGIVVQHVWMTFYLFIWFSSGIFNFSVFVKIIFYYTNCCTKFQIVSIELRLHSRQWTSLLFEFQMISSQISSHSSRSLRAIYAWASRLVSSRAVTCRCCSLCP